MSMPGVMLSRFEQDPARPVRPKIKVFNKFDFCTTNNRDDDELDNQEFPTLNSSVNVPRNVPKGFTRLSQNGSSERREHHFVLANHPAAR